MAPAAWVVVVWNRRTNRWDAKTPLLIEQEAERAREKLLTRLGRHESEVQKARFGVGALPAPAGTAS